MEYVKSNIPLWQVTIWDKKFNNVDKSWQPKVIKYRYIFSDRIEKIKRDYGDVVILYTGKNTGYTTKELAGEDLCNGEIVAIPWGGIPSVKYCKGNFVTGDNRIATSSNPNELDNKYLYYLLKSRINELSSYYRGASLKHPAMKNVLNMKISYPDIDRQKLIVKFLERIEEILTKQKRELFLLDTLIKARFVEMFGSANESGFPIKTLPEIVVKDKNSIKRGPFGGALKKEDFVDKGYLVYEQRHAIHNDFKYAKYYITHEKYKEMIGFKVKPKDLLISCSGVTLGRIAEVPEGAKDGIINQALLKLTLDQTVMMNTFFINQFKSSEIQEVLFGFSRGSGIPNMPSMNEVKSIGFICPPIELQNQFVSFVNQVDKSKVAYENKKYRFLYFCEV